MSTYNLFGQIFFRFPCLDFHKSALLSSSSSLLQMHTMICRLVIRSDSVTFCSLSYSSFFILCFFHNTHILALSIHVCVSDSTLQKSSFQHRGASCFPLWLERNSFLDDFEYSISINFSRFCSAPTPSTPSLQRSQEGDVEWSQASGLQRSLFSASVSWGDGIVTFGESSTCLEVGSPMPSVDRRHDLREECQVRLPQSYHFLPFLGLSSIVDLGISQVSTESVQRPYSAY